MTHIHAHFATEATTVAMFASILTNTPFSFTIHAYDLLVSPRFLREKVEHAHSVVTISEFNRQYLASLLLKDRESLMEKVNVVHQGISIEDFIYLRSQQTDFPSELPILLTIARLVPKKGHRYVMEALSLLKKRGIEARWIVAGDGPEKSMLMRLSQELGLENSVEFVGEIDSSQVKELLSVATIFVLPCVKDENGNMDGIPVAIMEAMAAGVPVVSTSVSGIPELIEHRTNGLLIAPFDVKALMDSIQNLLEDADLYDRIVYAGQERIVQEFDVFSSAKRLIKLFEANTRLQPSQRQ